MVLRLGRTNSGFGGPEWDDHVAVHLKDVVEWGEIFDTAANATSYSSMATLTFEKHRVCCHHSRLAA